MRLISILILMIIIFSFSGCSGFIGSDGPKKVDYHTGTTGLELRFLDRMPPSEIWEDASFVTSVEIKNKGTYDVENGVLSITNLPEQYIDLSDNNAPFTIEGKGPEYPEGGFGVISFNMKAKNFPEDKKELRIPFRVVAEYDYKTEASAQVCVSTDVFDIGKEDEQSCKPGDINYKSGQGAPVAISKIEELSRPFSETETEIGFKIEVRNSGSGEVIDKVEIDEVALGYNYMNCVPSSFELEKGKTASFTCNAVINNKQGSYISPLVILLEYEYADYIDKEIRIKELE